VCGFARFGAFFAVAAFGTGDVCYAHESRLLIVMPDASVNAVSLSHMIIIIIIIIIVIQQFFDSLP